QVQQELVAWAKDQLSGQVAEWQSGTGERTESGERGAESPLSSDPSRESGGEPFPQSGGIVVGNRNAPGDFNPVATDLPDHIAASDAGIVHVETSDAAVRPASEAAELRAMQVHDCYLVVATGSGLTVIDQHALHERILYERLRIRVLAGDVEVQRLLVPVTVDVSARDAALLEEHDGLLKEIGLFIEPFGGTTVALSGLPTLMRRAAPEELVRAVIDLLDQHGSNVSRRDVLDSLLHMMSCKAAIKSGQRLSAEEINALLAQRHLVSDAHHCPHGRPTALTLTREALDRQFGRLG
ncbi:MAG: DNA mismatch repair protein MutL, partial [Planctomycetaceae bacterium]|nr:DNA mismatch repair protein MutL [Planctomycetaceae bacterium]